MAEQRRHPRYEVSNKLPLQGSTENGPAGERLISISLGGCAFAAPSYDLRLCVGDWVRCSLEEPGHAPVTVEGKVIYINPYPVHDHVGRCYGIAFETGGELLVRPVIERIESLAARAAMRKVG
jgi:hypothetical protein